MNRLKVLLVLVGIWIGSSAEAQKIGAAEIYYIQYAPLKYKVTAVLYRQCNGPAINQLNGTVISKTYTTSMNFKRVSISTLNPLCGNPCNNLNAQGNPGYEKHIFEDTVDFNNSTYSKYVQAGDCDIRFAISQFTRDAKITNITIGNMYLDAMVNICQNLQSNHSPVFSVEPKFESCCNYQLSYNPGAIDTFDFDSLSFQMVSPLESGNTSPSYTGSFNSSIPMTPYCPPNPGVINCRALPNAKPPRGFYFDAVSGDIILTPTNCAEKAALRFQVNEFRKDSSNKWVLIGQISREMILEVFQCTGNNPPYINGTHLVSTCNNTPICFNGGTKDDQVIPKQLIADTTHVDWDHGIPDADFKIVDSSAREKSFKVCWTPNSTNSKSINRFTVIARSSACNIDMVSRAVVIPRNPKSDFYLQKDIINCSQLSYRFFPLDSVFQLMSKNSYSLRISHIDQPNINLFNSGKISNTFVAPRKGKYIIVSSCINSVYNCPVTKTDTVELENGRLEIAYQKDSMICSNSNVSLSSINDPFDGYQYKWYNDALGNGVADTSKIYTINFKQDSLKVKLTVTRNNCTFSDSVNLINTIQYQLEPSGKTIHLCNGEMATLKLRNLQAMSPYSIEWIANAQVIGTDTILNITPTQDSRLTIKIRDAYTCLREDTIELKTVILPDILMKDTGSCNGDVLTIQSGVVAQNYPIQYEWFLDSLPIGKNQNSLIFIPKQYHSLRLKISSSDACYKEKTINIEAYPKPVFVILGDSVYNKYAYVKLTIDDTFSSYYWFNGANTKDNDFWAYSLGAPGKYTIWCEVTNYFGCSSKREMRIVTNGKTGISDEVNEGLLVYPNPVESFLYIELLQATQIKIYSADGKFQMQQFMEAGENKIELSELASGVYLLEVDGQFYKIIKS